MQPTARAGDFLELFGLIQLIQKLLWESEPGAVLEVLWTLPKGEGHLVNYHSLVLDDILEPGKIDFIFWHSLSVCVRMRERKGTGRESVCLRKHVYCKGVFVPLKCRTFLSQWPELIASCFYFGQLLAIISIKSHLKSHYHKRLITQDSLWAETISN